MRSRTANWFVCKIRYEKTMEDGLQKKVTETYVVDAMSFTEAEARIIEEMKSYISGEFEVVEIDRAAWGEVFFSDEEIADKWYKSKLALLPSTRRQTRRRKPLSTTWYRGLHWRMPVGTSTR